MDLIDVLNNLSIFEKEGFMYLLSLLAHLKKLYVHSFI